MLAADAAFAHVLAERTAVRSRVPPYQPAQPEVARRPGRGGRCGERLADDLGEVGGLASGERVAGAERHEAAFGGQNLAGDVGVAGRQPDEGGVAGPVAQARGGVIPADRPQLDPPAGLALGKELGPAESHADSYFLMSADGSRPVAFTGDLAFHGTHPYTADGHLPQWLAALDVVAGELAGVGALYPGHGDPATPGVLAEQRRYLLYYRELVRRLSGGGPRLSPAAAAELDTAMQAFLPGAPLTWMIGLGADAVAGELAGAAAISQG